MVHSRAAGGTFELGNRFQRRLALTRAKCKVCHMGHDTEREGLHRRQQRTREQLISAARRLTATHGLSGFTVQELSDQVGVSRRTFFNYFASKEDAVLGMVSRV